MSQQVEKPVEIWVPEEMIFEDVDDALDSGFGAATLLVRHFDFQTLKAENEKLCDELTKYSGMTMSEADARVQLATLQESSDDMWRALKDVVLHMNPEKDLDYKRKMFSYIEAKEMVSRYEQYKQKVGQSAF